MSLFNRALRLTLPITPRPLVRFFARRYVAGDTLSDAVATVKKLSSEGCCATIDVLGESVISRDLARAAVRQYLAVLDAIQEHSLDANVSVKPTQMGLAIDEEFCRECFAAVLEKANSLGIFVCIDMEDSATTDATLRIYHSLSTQFPNRTGVVLQARLRRTLGDAVTLAATRTNIRLCKGVYLEPREIAYTERDIIRDNFLNVLKVLLPSGSYVAIATHDEWLVCQSLALVHRLALTRDRYEFQMLLGVDPQLRRIITSTGHRLRVYVPFGSHWYPYSVRRLRENPQIARVGLEAFLRGRIES